MEKSTFLLEKEFIEKGHSFVIGVDEAGRGPLCGPVLAAAVTLKKQELGIRNQEDGMWDLVRDSKKLSEKKRERFLILFMKIFMLASDCDHKTIDRINILEASF